MADRSRPDERSVSGASGGADEAQPAETLGALYHHAFEAFGPQALWSSRPVEHPTVADAMAIVRSLRVEGNLDARRLAERLEALCRAAL